MSLHQHNAHRAANTKRWIVLVLFVLLGSTGLLVSTHGHPSRSNRVFVERAVVEEQGASAAEVTPARELVAGPGRGSPDQRSTRVLPHNEAEPSPVTRAVEASLVCGHVVDRYGRAAPGARVSLGERSVRAGIGGWFEFEAAPGRADLALVATRSGESSAVIASFGLRLETPAASLSPVELRLGAPTTFISGTLVSADGAPCVGWYVPVVEPLEPWHESACGKRSRGDEPVPQTDRKGRFRVEVPAGAEHVLHAWNRESGAKARFRDLPAEAEDLLLRLPGTR